MPKKKTTKKTTTSKVGSSKVAQPKLANVKVTITHIVPTTEFGNVTYKAECDASQAEDVGVLLSELIGSLYPPFNPDNGLTAQPHTEDAPETSPEPHTLPQTEPIITTTGQDSWDDPREDISPSDFEPAF